MKITTTKLLAAALAVAGVALNAPAQTTIPVYSAQDFQNALTTAANTGGAYIIQLHNTANPDGSESGNGGYYIGNFNYNSGGTNNLTIEPANGLTHADITIDGTNGGRGLNITSSGSTGDVNVSDITFIRNCGSSTIGALRIAGSSGGTMTVDTCYFLSDGGR